MKIKKILLTTTALISMACMQSAFAHTKSVLKHKVHTHQPKLHLNIFGWLDAQAGFRAQDSKHTRTFLTEAQRQNSENVAERIGVTKNNRVVAFDTSALMRFQAKGKTSKGLLYVANIDVAADVNPSHEQNNNRFSMMNRTYIYIQDHDMGRLELGNNDGAAGTMLPTANDVAVATGGIGGDWAKYVVLQTPAVAPAILVDPNSFHLNAGSVLDQQGILPGLTPMQKPRKITYYTPKIQDTGIQLGASYVPDASNVTFAFANKALTPLGTPLLGYRDGLSGGISWEDKFSGHNFKIGLVGEYARASKEAKAVFHNLGSVGIGMSYMYKDLSAAISYNYLSKTGLRKQTATQTLKPEDHNYVATLGFAYKIDQHTDVSLTGLLSEKWDNKFYNISLGAQYKLTSGMLPYAEVSLFRLKQHHRFASAYPTTANCDACGISCSPITNNTDETSRTNRGASFIIGTRIAF